MASSASLVAPRHSDGCAKRVGQDGEPICLQFRQIALLWSYSDRQFHEPDKVFSRIIQSSFCSRPRVFGPRHHHVADAGTRCFKTPVRLCLAIVYLEHLSALIEREAESRDTKNGHDDKELSGNGYMFHKPLL